LEDLSDASFLDKLLVLPANVRLDWKVFAGCKHSSLLGLVISNEEKSFITLTTGVNIIQLFFFVADATAKKLDRLNLAVPYSLI
jgi:hypothetical protein